MNDFSPNKTSYPSNEHNSNQQRRRRPRRRPRNDHPRRNRDGCLRIHTGGVGGGGEGDEDQRHRMPRF